MTRMDEHVGKSVKVRGEKSPARIVEYRGRNGSGSETYLVQLHSKATRIYAAQNLLLLVAGKAMPLDSLQGAA